LTNFKVSPLSLKAILDKVPAAVHVKDSSGRYVLVNTCFERILKRESGRIIGRTDHELWPAPVAEAIRANDLRVLRGAAAFECEEVARADDGPRSYLSLKFPLDCGHERFACSIAVDTTARTRNDSAKNEALALAAHELRAPVAAAQGALPAFAPAAPAAAPPEGAPLADRLARRNSRQMLAVIDTYLDLAAIENGESSLKSDDVDLRAIAAKAVESMLHDGEAKELRFMLKLGTEPMLVRGDADRLRAILDNLLSNSVKHSPEEAEIELCVAAHGDSRRVTVREHGLGIRGASVPPVFQGFPRDGGATEVIKGTGLGLTIAKELVERMGGAIWVQTQEGTGTTYTIDFPAAPPARSAAGNASP
jgi:PAS domain S-box-containing protein